MAYESYYTNKIIKTTKAQYDVLKNGESVKGYKLNEKDTFVLDIDSLYNDLNKYTQKTIMLPDNTSLDTVTESGFYRLNMNPNFPHAQMIVSRGADTIAQMAFPYADTTMYVRTGNPFNPSSGLWHDWKQVAFTDHTHTSINTAFVFKNEDMPEAEGSAISANLAGTTTAHKLTLYRNGLSIPYQMNDSNDGGILRCRGTSESNTIFELATWDDSGAGETIQFNYYPTNSQATPTYSVTVPKKTGTIALTSDIPGTASSSALGLVKSSTTGTTPNRDYKVQVNDDGTMKVNVPWTDTRLNLDDINYDHNNIINIGSLDINTGITFNNNGTIQQLIELISPASDVIRRSINLVFTSVKQSGNTLGKVNSLMMTANISKTSNSDSVEYLLVGYFKITVSSNDRRIYKLYIGLSNSINGYQCDAFKCELYGTF